MRAWFSEAAAQLQIQTNIFHYTAAISACEKAANWFLAIHLLDRMHQDPWLCDNSMEYLGTCFAHVLVGQMQSVVLWSMSSERQGPVYYAMLIHASHSRRGCPNLTLRLPLTNQLLVGVYVHFCICRPALCGKKKLRSGACIMASPGATWHPPHSQTVVLGMLGAKLTKPSYLLRCMDSVPKKHAA